MGVIQDSEYVLYKAVAEQIKSGLMRPLNILNTKCLKEFSKFEKQKALFLSCETFEDLGDNSKKLKNSLRSIISLLAIQDRLEKIVKRNEQRLEFISLKLQQMGIYNDAVDKKTVSSALSSESKNVSEESLNLNPKANRGITLKFFNGEILAFRDDELDFSLEENREVLLGSSVEFLHSVIETFPYAVATIPDDYYAIAEFKNKILKECVLFVASKVESQTIAESNKQLGGLLERAGELTGIAQFATELRNCFNVIVKQTLRSQFPKFEDEINSELKCNEYSIFLPKLRRLVSDSVGELEEEIEETPEVEEEKASVEKNKDGIEKEESQEDSEEGMSTKELVNLLMDDEDDLDEELNDDEGSDKLERDDEIDDVLKELSGLFGDDEALKTDESSDKKLNEKEKSVSIAQAEESKEDADSSIDEEIDEILKDLEDLFDSDDDKNEE